MRGDIPDRSIPFYNTLMRCDAFDGAEPVLPEGYRFVTYQPGYEKDWARLETAVGDFDTEREAEAYFVNTYGEEPDELRRRCVMVADEDGRIAGSCIAWRDPRGAADVASLHWLIVDPQAQGQGLGRALAVRTMQIFAENGELPVYIHTQPWSWKAILLYDSIGFRLQKTDTFSHYENQYPQVMETLRAVLREDQYERLVARVME